METPLPINILYADDDIDDRDLFEEIVKEPGLNCTLSMVANGQDLFIYLNRPVKFDIIFLDIKMPGISGTECLKRIRKDSRFDRVPVVMLSTYSEEVLKTMVLGANLYMSKMTFFNSHLSQFFCDDWREKLLSKDAIKY